MTKKRYIQVMVVSQRCLLMLALSFGVVPFARGALYYVSTNGVGSGTLSSPMSLTNAIASRSPVQPGDTIYLRGGTYTAPNFKCQLVGTAASPIIVRQYPGERAILNGSDTNQNNVLDVESFYTWYWGFEITQTSTNRYCTGNPEAAFIPQGVGMNMTYPGCGNKLINLIIHDVGDAIFASPQGTNLEVTGCIIYNNGYDASDGKGHGHHLYMQNNPNNGTQLFQNNIMLNCFSTGIAPHGSGSGNGICGMTLLNNIVYGSGAASIYGPYENHICYCGTNKQDTINVDNYIFGGNVGFSKGSLNWTFGYAGYFPNQGSVTVTNNLSVQGGVQLYWWTNVVFTGNTLAAHINGGYREDFTNALSFVSDYNTFYGPGYGLKIQTFTNGSEGYLSFPTWQAAGYDTHSTLTVGAPGDTTVVIQKNPYESGRANIAIANWHTNDNVSVDLSGVLSTGTVYTVQNAADYFAPPVASGTYNGGAISLPMTNLSVAMPIGGTNCAPATGPQFNAFVLLPLSGSSLAPASNLRRLSP